MKISDTKKLAAITAAFFITVTAFSGCSESANSSQTTSSFSQAAKSDIDASIAAEDIDVGYDEESSIGITFADGSAAIDGEGATSEGETVTISQAGTYILSGTATNGRIIVSADKTAEIKLIFNGVDITCADNAPLLVSKAKKVYIVLTYQNTVPAWSCLLDVTAADLLRDPAMLSQSQSPIDRPSPRT